MTANTRQRNRMDRACDLWRERAHHELPRVYDQIIALDRCARECGVLTVVEVAG